MYRKRLMYGMMWFPMYIFYDFETSSRELIGQIMTYAFVVTDLNLNVTDVLEGAIQLRPTELPEVEAILVNRIDVAVHQKNSLREVDAAHQIFQFLSQCVQRSGVCTLVGFNSNKFDLGFLRNLLIHYGYNPYFFGKLKNLDILHFSQYLGFRYREHFPWIKVEDPDRSYYSFKLEDLSFSLGTLDGKQTHSAIDDVHLLIETVRVLVERFEMPLDSFQPVFWYEGAFDQSPYALIRVKERHFPTESEPLQHFVYRYYAILSQSGKQTLVVSLDKLQNALDTGNELSQDIFLEAMRSVNENKHFFIAEPVTSDMPEGYRTLAEAVFKDPFIQSLVKNSSQYYTLIKKDWDIDYQIHELGFSGIDSLRNLVLQLSSNPDAYVQLVKKLWSQRSSEKDVYLVQLFNRIYLWTHPSPEDQYLKKYMYPRYVSGTMLRNSDTFVSIEARLSKMNEIMADESYSEEDKHLVQQLLDFYQKKMPFLCT